MMLTVYFSVKSAYKDAYSMRNQAFSSHSSIVGVSMWRAIWQAKIPGKAKVRVWRACLNSLPTRANVEKKMSGGGQ